MKSGKKHIYPEVECLTDEFYVVKDNSFLRITLENTDKDEITVHTGRDGGAGIAKFSFLQFRDKLNQLIRDHHKELVKNG